MGMNPARWRNLLTAFWVVPLATILVCAALALIVVWIDRRVDTGSVEFLFGGDASAARGILSAVAGAFATIVGIVLSITIVTLQLVSSQFSSRALQGLLEDRLNQLVAGAFVGVFIYCLLVLRTVRSEDTPGGPFVPPLSVTAAITLGVLGLVLLILFIHHVSETIQLSTIAERIGGSTLDALDRLYPEPFDRRSADESGPEFVRRWNAESGEPAVVRPARPGYVRSIALGTLLEGLGEGDRLHVRVRPGDFVTEGSPLASLWSADGRRDERVDTIRRTVNVSSRRDMRQDAAFGIQQLADIAVRALSPGVNDPTTAVTCVGYLQAGLERLARRTLPSALIRVPGRGTVAVVEVRTFAEYVEGAFLEVGRHASRDARVVAAVLDSLARVATAVMRAGSVERLAGVLEVAEAVALPATDEARSALERERLGRALEEVRLTCAVAGGSHEV